MACALNLDKYLFVIKFIQKNATKIQNITNPPPILADRLAPHLCADSG